MWILQLAAGSLLMGLAVNLFLLPLKLAEGGAIGIAILVYHTLKWRPAWTVLALNVPLVIWAWRERGWGFIVRSLIGIGAFTLAIAVTGRLEPVTHVPLLGIVYGGLCMGVGLGLVLRSGATTGGTDMLATLLHRRLGLSVGQMILIIDAAVLVAAGFTFGWEQALYSALTLGVSSRAVDFVQEGFYGAKGVTIMTSKPRAVAQRILSDLERGCTILQGTGAYTGEARAILYSVVQRSELTAIKRLVYDLDPRAFVVVGDVHEVLGEGFRQWEAQR